MSELKKAGSVILGDLKMFNEAVVHFENEISPAFMEAIGDCFQEWGDSSGWFVALDDEEYAHWLAPQSWCFEDKKEKNANHKFYLDFDVNADEGRDCRLASLCGLGTNEAALYFSYNLSGINNKPKKADIKTAVDMAREKCDESLRALGFVFIEDFDSYYLPLKLDANLLASAWEQDDYKEFLKPLNAALNTIEESAPTFDALFKNIQAVCDKS